MYLQTKSVPGSVAVNREVSFFYDFSRSRIDLADFDSGFDHSYGGGLCLFYDGVNFVIKPAGCADRKASGQITAVAVEAHAEVDEDGIIFS